MIILQGIAFWDIRNGATGLNYPRETVRSSVKLLVRWAFSYHFFPEVEQSSGGGG
jgi:hypothetical protein